MADKESRMFRRSFLRRVAYGTGLGGLSSLPVFPMHPSLSANETQDAAVKANPVRFIFYLQNHGFHPEHCRPIGAELLKKDAVLDDDLQKAKLPEYIKPLMPYRDMMTLVLGLSGSHVKPRHSAGYGVLGGYLKTTTARAISIDARLAQLNPATIPLLGLSWDALSKARANPVLYGVSAWGRNKAVAGYADPRLLYRTIFGGIGEGEAKAAFDLNTAALDLLKTDIDLLSRDMPVFEREKMLNYQAGLDEMIRSRNGLQAMAPALKKFRPDYEETFDNPEHETDWWELSLKCGLAALQAGVTNVLTIASGACRSQGSFSGIGISATNIHNAIGHSDPLTNPDWVKIRQYNMKHLVQIVETLKATPETNGAGGAMMDNTVIVYTSCHGERHHSLGIGWPYLLLGNLGGRLRTGRLLQYPHQRTPGLGKGQDVTHGRMINALYCSLLNAAGLQTDSFNLPAQTPASARGPLDELMA